MTVGTLVGVALVVIGAVVLALGTASVARVNPTERIPYPGNQGYRRYVVAYAIGFMMAFLGGSQLRQEHGWWALVAGFVVLLVPFLSICVVHQRRVRRVAAR